MHICRLSRVGARLRAEDIPVSPGARAVAAMLGQDPLELALRGGRSYQSLFTCAPEAAPRLPAAFTRAGLPAPRPIGDMVTGSEVVLITKKKKKLFRVGV